MRKLYEAQDLLLRELDKLAPADQPAGQVENAVQDIENNLGSILEQEIPAEPAEPAPPEPKEPARTGVKEPARTGVRERTPAGLDSTRRFDDLQFGKDYEIR